MANQIGALIVDVEGKKLSSEERELLAHPLVGGVILFTRNYESRQQLQHLCQAIRASRKQPILILVDQEGGRVQRFIPEFTRLPPMAVFGDQFDGNSNKVLEQAKDCGWLMATELLSAGVDLSLAPVLDLNKAKNPAIGNRAFHADPQKVTALAKAFAQGMREAGMAATGKHFPGHGSVTVDSHVAVPTDQRSLNDIAREDLVPFTGLIQAGLSAIMTSHIIFPQVDAHPVGFSRIWLQDILRAQLEFKGVIFSDDLNMQGANISNHYADRVTAAREAGCDFMLLCNNRNAVIEVLDKVPAASNQISPEKWRALQPDLSNLKKSYHEDARWLKTRENLQLEKNLL